VFIARQDISSAQAETLAQTFSQMIVDNGGKIAKTEHWGLKTLAFRMNKNRKGHYVLLNIDAPSAAVLEMERNMRINEDVLRYMSIRVDEHEEGPSAMMQNRDRGGERGDRGDRGDRGGLGRPPRPRRDEGETTDLGVTE
jgi:small subunit ribosomal protein S6